MKKLIRRGLVIISVLCCCVGPVDTGRAAGAEHKPAEGSTEELFQDVYLTLLEPSIQKAVSDYYKPYFKDPPGPAPYETDVLSIDRPYGYRTFVFIIKVQVMPYFGPHLHVGVDNITLRIGAGSEVQLERFEHLKSFPLPPNYQDEIIGRWPPAQA
jgi:hypothetical protein